MINKGIREGLYCVFSTKATKGAFINKGFGVLEFRVKNLIHPLFSPVPLVAPIVNRRGVKKFENDDNKNPYFPKFP